jgi:hypothetical protein
MNLTRERIMSLQVIECCHFTNTPTTGCSLAHIQHLEITMPSNRCTLNAQLLLKIKLVGFMLTLATLKKKLPHSLTTRQRVQLLKENLLLTTEFLNISVSIKDGMDITHLIMANLHIFTLELEQELSATRISTRNLHTCKVLPG